MHDGDKFQRPTDKDTSNPIHVRSEILKDGTRKAPKEGEPLYISPEFEIEEPGGGSIPDSTSYGGLLRDIENLKSVIDILRRMKVEETQSFLVRWITFVFVVWTIAGLIESLTIQSHWLLITDFGPGTLFNLIVYYYFKKNKRKGDRDR